MKATVAEAVEIGTQLPSLSVRFTRERLVRYGGASTDFNPIHYSEYFAAHAGLPGVIAHGMFTMGTALRVVTNWIGDPSRVTSYSARFPRPVVVPDGADGVEVEFSASVSAIEGSLVTVSIEAISDGQKVLGAARAEVDLGVRVPHRDHEGSHVP
jgi:acyl dehydratase